MLATNNLNLPIINTLRDNKNLLPPPDDPGKNRRKGTFFFFTTNDFFNYFTSVKPVTAPHQKI